MDLLAGIFGPFVVNKEVVGTVLLWWGLFQLVVAAGMHSLADTCNSVVVDAVVVDSVDADVV